jgi:hypothetical protein
MEDRAVGICPAIAVIEIHAQAINRNHTTPAGYVAEAQPWRAAKHLRDLGIGEPFVVAEHQDGALPPGQLPELGQEGGTLCVSEGVGHGKGGRRPPGPGLRAPAARTFGARTGTR